MSSRLSAILLAGFIATFFGFSSRAIAQTDSRLTSAPWNPGSIYESNDRPVYEAQSSVEHEHANAQVLWWDSFGRFRLDKNNPNPDFSLGYRWVTMSFDTNSHVLPDHLDDMSLAAGLHLTPELSVIGGAGYTSNSPFSDINGLYGIAHVMYEHQVNEKDSLLLSINYNGNSAFLPDVPLPGVQWVHRENPFSYGIGFPDDFASWQITPQLRFDAIYSFPYSAEGQLNYDLNQHITLFLGGANFFDGFELRDQSSTDRLFYQLSRAETGIRYRDTIWGMYVDVALTVGYAFDQNFDRGFDARQLNHLSSFSDEPYIGLILIGRL